MCVYIYIYIYMYMHMYMYMDARADVHPRAYMHTYFPFTWHLSSNMQHTTSNIQHPICNIQHTYHIISSLLLYRCLFRSTAGCRSGRWALTSCPRFHRARSTPWLSRMSKDHPDTRSRESTRACFWFSLTIAFVHQPVHGQSDSLSLSLPSPLDRNSTVQQRAGFPQEAIIKRELFIATRAMLSYDSAMPHHSRCQGIQPCYHFAVTPSFFLWAPDNFSGPDGEQARAGGASRGRNPSSAGDERGDRRLHGC